MVGMKVVVVNCDKEGNVDLNDFPVLPYREAIEKYGTDKPDLRFEMLINDFKPFSDKSDFKAFSSCEAVRMIHTQEADKFSRKVIDEMDAYAQSIRAKEQAWFKVNNDDFEGGISKFFASELRKEIIKNFEIKDNSICFMVGDKLNNSLKILGKVISKLGDMLNLKDNNLFSPVWIVDFPLFDWNEETERFDSVNHPFTAPKDFDIKNVWTPNINIPTTTLNNEMYLAPPIPNEGLKITGKGNPCFCDGFPIK